MTRSWGFTQNPFNLLKAELQKIVVNMPIVIFIHLFWVILFFKYKIHYSNLMMGNGQGIRLPSWTGMGEGYLSFTVSKSKTEKTESSNSNFAGGYNYHIKFIKIYILL